MKKKLLKANSKEFTGACDEFRLKVMIDKAYKREYADDHLEDDERKVIVDLYNKVYPNNEFMKLSLTDAFVEIVMS